MRTQFLKLVARTLGAASFGAAAVLLACTPKAPGGDVAPQDSGPDTGPPGSACAHKEPPPPPDVHDAGGSLDLVFAVRATCFPGSSLDDGGIPLFKSVGFDLDHTCTGQGEGPSCLEPPSATPTDYQDGVGGVDNAYTESGYASGELPASGPFCMMSTQNAAVELFRVRGYSGGLDDDQVEVSQYWGFGLSPRADGRAGPLWDGNDRWTIIPETLGPASDAGTTLSEDVPLFKDDHAYVTGGVLVAELETARIAGGPVAAPTVLFPVYQLVLSGRLISSGDGAGPTWQLEDVIEGGRIPITTALGAWGRQPTAVGSTDLECSTLASYGMLKQRFCPFVDISSRPGSPPTVPCDALSGGGTLQITPALLGDIGPPAQLLPPCGPGIFPESEYLCP